MYIIILFFQRRMAGPPTSFQTAAYFTCFALQGVCSGTAMTQMIIVLSDWVGPERMAKSLAIMMVNLGLLYVPAQAVLGEPILVYAYLMGCIGIDIEYKLLYVQFQAISVIYRALMRGPCVFVVFGSSLAG